MVCDSFVGFDWGFYFWSGVFRSQGVTYDTLMRRYIKHIRVQSGISKRDSDYIIKRGHRRVLNVLTKDQLDYLYCTKVGRGVFPASHDTCFHLFAYRSKVNINNLSDCCFNCAVLLLDYIIKLDPVSRCQYKYFSLNARA